MMASEKETPPQTGCYIADEMLNKPLDEKTRVVERWGNQTCVEAVAPP